MTGSVFPSPSPNNGTRPPPQPVRPLPQPSPTSAVPAWVKAVVAVQSVLIAGVLAVLLWGHVPHPGPVPPGPEPSPAPAPSPGAYTGPLWGVLVLPNPPTTEQSALRINEPVKNALGPGRWRSYLVDESEVADSHWKPLVDRAGGPPVVLWLKPDGFLAATKAPTEANVLADFKKIRGEK